MVMEYLEWRADIFGRPVGSDPVTLELLPETDALTLDQHFDHVDRALSDREIHALFDADQIGIGLNLIFNGCCSNISSCYVEAGDEHRRLAGIAMLDELYANYFARYSLSTVGDINGPPRPRWMSWFVRSPPSPVGFGGSIGDLCFMFWDSIVLNPGNASPAMASAAIDVMANALQMSNETCIASAIHGLGHWADVRRAPHVLKQWLRRPTTRNPSLIAYARDAVSGGIL